MATATVCPFRLSADTTLCRGPTGGSNKTGNHQGTSQRTGLKLDSSYVDSIALPVDQVFTAAGHGRLSVGSQPTCASWQGIDTTLLCTLSGDLGLYGDIRRLSPPKLAANQRQQPPARDGLSPVRHGKCRIVHSPSRSGLGSCRPLPGSRLQSSGWDLPEDEGPGCWCSTCSGVLSRLPHGCSRALRRQSGWPTPQPTRSASRF